MRASLPCFLWVEFYTPPFSSLRYLPPLPLVQLLKSTLPPPLTPHPSPLPSPCSSSVTLFGLKINGPLAVSKETVILAHFLDGADAIVKSVDAIGTLDAQAQVCVWGWEGVDGGGGGG